MHLLQPGQLRVDEYVAVSSSRTEIEWSTSTRWRKCGSAQVQLLQCLLSRLASCWLRLWSMNELALFAGAGGGLLGSSLLGWQPVCAVEIDGYRRSVLMARQDDGTLPVFPIWDDIRTFDGLEWRGRVDVVSGGFPCQAYSSAARGRNTADDLWPEMRRVVAEVAPRYVFAENVARAAIDAAADDLEAMGYKTRCSPLSARDMGADHIRPRYWLRAYADNEGELLRSVDAEVAELQSLCKGVWSSEPGGSRVADGLARRVERLEATGEGQVAIVAAAAWRLLSV